MDPNDGFIKVRLIRALLIRLFVMNHWEFV
jgi:hypothetical protein